LRWRKYIDDDDATLAFDRHMGSHPCRPIAPFAVLNFALYLIQCLSDFLGEFSFRTWLWYEIHPSLQYASGCNSIGRIARHEKPFGNEERVGGP
jgi:hypothetical protein